ncbi:MAG: glycosyltransferase family 4 protein [Tepidamorphaceae bacterium]
MFAGHRQNIADWIAACDLLLHPAYEEGLAPRFDAMHLEVPIVASRVDGIPEIAIDGTSALLIEPGDTAGLADAALRVLNDDALRAHIVAGGREVAARLGPKATGQSYLDLYESILGGTQP